MCVREREIELQANHQEQLLLCSVTLTHSIVTLLFSFLVGAAVIFRNVVLYLELCWSYSLICSLTNSTVFIASSNVVAGVVVVVVVAGTSVVVVVSEDGVVVESLMLWVPIVSLLSANLYPFYNAEMNNQYCMHN